MNFFEIEQKYLTNTDIISLSSEEMEFFLTEIQKPENGYPNWQTRRILWKEMSNAFFRLVKRAYTTKINEKSMKSDGNLNFGDGYQKRKNRFLRLIGDYNEFSLGLMRNKPFFLIKEENIISQINNHQKGDNDKKTHHRQIKHLHFCNTTGFVYFCSLIFGNFFPLRIEIKNRFSQKLNDIYKENCYIIPLSRCHYYYIELLDYENDFEYMVKFTPTNHLGVSHLILEWYASDGIFSKGNPILERTFCHDLLNTPRMAGFDGQFKQLSNGYDSFGSIPKNVCDKAKVW